MAKRLTDNTKWKMKWWRELGSQGRDLWNYLHDNCDHAGMFEIDLEWMGKYLGFEVTLEKIKEVLRGKLIFAADDRLFLYDFVDFQYGELSEDCKPHLSVIKILKKQRVWEQYTKTIQSLKDKDKDKDIIGESEGNLNPADLFDIWNTHRGVLPKAVSLSPTRKKHAAARLKENPDPQYWIGMVQKLAASDFCQGKNDRGWIADFDFLLKPETHIKITEGKYQSKPRANQSTGIDVNL